MNISYVKLLAELDRRIEFYRENQNDPHGIGISVICALEEIRSAVKASILGQGN